MSPRLQLGIEHNPAAREAGITANWVALAETDAQPMLSFGTSSDRIFSPAGTRSYSATLGKSLPSLKCAPYVGLTYSTWERRLLVPAGVNVELSPQWSALPMYDGRHVHMLVTNRLPGVNVTLMAVKLRHFGISLGFGF